jgi:Xaa-Pro aminopeptidase
VSHDAPAAVIAPLDVAGRISRLRERLPEVAADALLVTNLQNVRYLTGFSGSAAELLVGPSRALLVTDGRYRTQAAEQLQASGAAGEVETFVGKVSAQREEIQKLVRLERARSVALEADNVTWIGKRKIGDLLDPAELVANVGLVEHLRLTKDSGELDRMARAAAIADAALAEVLPMLGERRSEREFALALDTAMRRLGAEDRAFDTIVASGPNAAKPHARPGDRVVSEGDPVVVDFGATFEGYRSDMTRTFCVADAQSAGVAKVRARVSAGDVDRASREIVADAGWASAFEHGTGHGVGLDIHEAPAVAEGSTTLLEAGFVVTVEPGVYLPGVGGVRIEDTVVVDVSGCRPLTRFPKDVVVSSA